MASRTFIDSNFSMIKRMVHIFADVNSPEGAAAATLQKWNYPVFGTGPNARTYTAAPVATALPSGPGPYPLQYTAGAEGVLSTTRTGTGLWTIKFQDNYQRLMSVIATPSSAGGTPTFAMVSKNTTTTNMASVGGSLVGLAFWDFAGAAVDPIGHVRLAFILGDATEP